MGDNGRTMGIQIIGHFIHNRMFEALGIDTSPGAPLLHRELECLRGRERTQWEREKSWNLRCRA